MSEQPLSTWKGIAKYLGVTTKTAQRYERTEGLPVHRATADLSSPSKAQVFAFPSEIVVWLKRRRSTDPVFHNAERGRLSRVPFVAALLGTHPGYVVLWGLAYATFGASAVWLELAYELPRFQHLANRAGPLVFLCLFLAAWLAFRLIEGLVRHDSRYSLAAGSAITVAVALLNWWVLSLFLPDFPVALATFQTYPPDAAYLKDTAYSLIVALFFMLPPFAFIRAAEVEMRSGTLESLRGFLERTSGPCVVRGALYVPTWVLIGLFLFFLVNAASMMTHFTDNLIAGEFSSLLQQILWFRMTLFIVAVSATLWWYVSAQAEIRTRLS